MPYTSHVKTKKRRSSFVEYNAILLLLAKLQQSFLTLENNNSML
jgi:hypothetical protein